MFFKKGPVCLIIMKVYIVLFNFIEEVEYLELFVFLPYNFK